MVRQFIRFTSFKALKQQSAVLLAVCAVLFVQVVAAQEVVLSTALEAAKVQVPGKVISHEKAEEMVGEEGAKVSQPVYRIKILSDQGVMKTLLVHRTTGKVVQ